MPPVSSALTGDRVKTAVPPHVRQATDRMRSLSLFIVLTVVFLCHPESWVGKGRLRIYVMGHAPRLGTVAQRLLSVPF